MSIIADNKDPHDSEYFEMEFHRLMGEAEAFTGAEKLRQKVAKMNRESAILELQKFIQNELAMREPQLTPYTLEATRKRIREKSDLDDWQTGGEFKDFKDYPKKDEGIASSGNG